MKQVLLLVLISATILSSCVTTKPSASFLDIFEKENKRVTIIPFRVDGLDRNESRYIEKNFEEIFGYSRKLTIVDFQEIKSIVDIQKINLSGFIDDDQAVEFGKILAADSLIIGEAIRLSDGINISIKMVNIETGVLEAVKNFLFKDFADFDNFIKLEKDRIKLDDKIVLVDDRFSLPVLDITIDGKISDWENENIIMLNNNQYIEYFGVSRDDKYLYLMMKPKNGINKYEMTSFIFNINGKKGFNYGTLSYFIYFNEGRFNHFDFKQYKVEYNSQRKPSNEYWNILSNYNAIFDEVAEMSIPLAWLPDKDTIKVDLQTNDERASNGVQLLYSTKDYSFYLY